jgi:hypothetical protein
MVYRESPPLGLLRFRAPLARYLTWIKDADCDFVVLIMSRASVAEDVVVFFSNRLRPPNWWPFS